MAAFAPLAADPHWRGTVKRRHVRGAPERRDCCRSACATTGRATSCGNSTDAAAEGHRRRHAHRARQAHPFVLLEAINGRARIEPEGGAAFGQREARWNVSALAIWEDPADDDAQIDWARRTAASFAPSSYSGAGYGNYAPVDETDDRVRAGYGPERYARLQAIKRRYDPDNVFRFNLNIPPAPPPG